MFEGTFPEPPAEFRGTRLEWRMKFPMSTDLRGVLVRRLPTLGFRDRKAVLLQVRWLSDPAFAEPLLSVADAVQNDPQTLHCYAEALAQSTRAAAQERRQRGRHRNQLPAPDATDREVVRASLEILVRLSTEWAGVHDEQGWSGIRTKLLRLRDLTPELFEEPSVEERVEVIRTAMEEHLALALVKEAGYRGGASMFRFAADIADHDTCDLLLRLLDCWETVRGKFWTTSQRADVEAWCYAVSGLIEKADAVQRVMLAEYLCRAFEARGADDESRKRLKELARRLEHHPLTEPAVRDVLIPVFGKSQPFFRK